MPTPAVSPRRRGRTPSSTTIGDWKREFSKLLTKVSEDVILLKQRSVDDAKESDDHETRIRALELSFAALAASRNTGLDLGKWVLPVIVSTLLLGVALLNYLK